MRVLGLDTATSATTVAVLDTTTERVLERRDDPPAGARPRHTAQLLALAAQALAAAGTDWAGIDLVAVGVGPGTFTGIRIGVASARALASARGVPIVGVPTLHALAAGASAQAGREDGVRGPLAVLDARRREVFAAAWSTPDAGDARAEPRRPARALAPAELSRELAASGERWLAVGDGALASRALLEDAGARVPPEASPLHRVSAVWVCRLALALPGQRPDAIHPEYLREPDAELTRRAAEVGAP